MSYATTDELKSRLAELFANLYVKNDGTAMDAEAVADLAAAEAEIDGALGVRYHVPVAAQSCAALLKNWTITLAEELAWSRSGRAEIPPMVRTRVARVREELDRIASGARELANAEERSTPGASPVLARTEYPVFTRDAMRRF